MTTFLKLIFTALVLNACFQAGRSAWTFYQFEDAVQSAVLFSAKLSPEQLESRIVELAAQYQVPLSGDDIGVTYVQTQARITGSYTDDVAVIPGGFAYPWTHTLDLDVRRVPF